MKHQDNREAAKRVIADVFRPLVDGLIKHPDVLKFDVIERNFGLQPGLCIVMVPHRGDFTRLYGKMRRNYDALETVAVNIGIKCGVPVRLGRLGEDGPGEADRFEYRGDWDTEGSAKFGALFQRLCSAVFPGDPKVEIIKDANGDVVAKIRTHRDDPSLQQSRYDALSVLSTALAAKYYVVPIVELNQEP
jgi:hypothetical protein